MYLLTYNNHGKIFSITFANETIALRVYRAFCHLGMTSVGLEKKE